VDSSENGNQDASLIVKRNSWQIITGEYANGGVGDYTRRVAGALARAGDEVHVWTPRSADSATRASGVLVHSLPGHFGPRALLTLDHAVSAAPDSIILVQYVPHAFGFKAMNLPFCWWLLARRRRRIWVMFHEVAFGAESPGFRYTVLELITKWMAKALTKVASRIFVSTASWKRMLWPMLRRSLPIEVLPLPSNVDLVQDAEAVESVRAQYTNGHSFLVGHFSAHPQQIQPYLWKVIPALLSDTRLALMLIGKGSCEFMRRLAPRCNGAAQRLFATGEIGSDELSLRISACDLMIQPYPDGISTRRTSAIAAIAHQRPVVTTKGVLTEPIWSDSDAVSLVPVDDGDKFVSAVCRLLDDACERRRLSMAAAELYRESFDLQHTISALRR
jgi:glycosyltransferase involved in cell wall biosynthesis